MKINNNFHWNQELVKKVAEQNSYKELISLIVKTEDYDIKKLYIEAYSYKLFYIFEIKKRKK